MSKEFYEAKRGRIVQKSKEAVGISDKESNVNESQKKKAKRLFEILKEMGYIKDQKYVVPNITRVEMSLVDEKAWIQALTEAISIYKAEELEAEWKPDKKITMKITKGLRWKN